MSGYSHPQISSGVILQNILRNRPSIDELARCFERHPPTPLLPPLGDPAWAAAAAKPILLPTIKAIQSRAAAEVDQPLPELPVDSYAEFHRNGNRLRHETAYFERRRRLARAAIAALVTSDPADRTALLNSTLVKLTDLFNERSWALPAHVRNVSGIDPMTIDLFSAESANLFGEMLDLFPSLLPPAFREKIHRRLRIEYFQNYLDHPPGWSTSGHNWNAVCHQGVLGAALATLSDAHLLAKLFDRAAEGLPMFLAGFSADGGSSEGPGYWSYGFGWMAELNRQLETRTGGELSLFEGDQRCHAIATFGPKMTLSHGLCVNFSDNAPETVPRPSLLTYLAGRFSDPFIAAQADIGWRHVAQLPVALDQTRGDLFYFTRQLLLCPQSVPQSVPQTNKFTQTDHFLPDLGVAVLRFCDSRNRLWEFAVKAGNNAEHHNHNDVGSYLLNIDGRRLLVEIGAPEYVREFFGPTRYTFIAARSLGHPVPLIDGKEQPSGKEYHGIVLSKQFDEHSASIEIDLTAAYPTDAGCTRCVRAVHIDKRLGEVKIADAFDLSRAVSIETALVADSAFEIADGVATLAAGSLRLRITPGRQTRLAGQMTHQYSTHTGKPAVLHRLALRPATPAMNGVLEYAVTVE